MSLNLDEFPDDQDEHLEKVPDVPDVRDSIVDVALSRAIPSALFRDLKAGKPLALIVCVPSAQWVAPVAEAIEEMTPKGTLLVQGTEVPKTGNAQAFADKNSTIARRLSAGKIVVGISHEPSRRLPQTLVSAAGQTIVVSPLSQKELRQVLRRCATGSIPRMEEALAVQTLDFEELASLIPIGQKAGAIVTSIREALQRRNSAVNDDGTLPELFDCVEFGEARTWALDLAQDIQDFKAGKIGWKDCDRGVVLHGPTGTGKTTLARLLGKACGVPTIVASVAELFATSSGYLDSVIKAQRQLFERARAQAPCILFLDEINSLPNVDTVGSRNKDYWMPVILDFYTLLDSAVSNREGVVVVGATNRLQDINPALLRGGRLERAIYVGPPDAVGVERILRQHLDGNLCEAELGPLCLAAEASGMTGATIMEGVRAARRRARRENRPMQMADLENALLPPYQIDQADLMRMAIHEAGHAYLGAVLAGDRLQRVDLLFSTNPTTGVVSGGRVRFAPLSPLQTSETMENEAAILLAGRVAEEVFLGSASTGAGGSETSDLALATRLLAQMHASFGLGDMLAYRGDASRLDGMLYMDHGFLQMIDVDLKRIAERVRVTFEEQRHVISALAGELIARKSLDAHQVKSIIGVVGSPRAVH
ncbi:AAA family ATPase [Devosia naphthalenivorans]|uniref:AAA family ATPase n=1 Tax=Devosia naphthalenivorans TaxID=2082392 RepID=UPI0013B05E1B|nr:AAA family ATPase [Devosia naphthalenivorans]